MWRWLKRSKADKTALPPAQPAPSPRMLASALRTEGLDLADEWNPPIARFADLESSWEAGNLALFGAPVSTLVAREGTLAPSPFPAAPIFEAAGGTVFFGSTPSRADLDAMLRLLDVRTNSTTFAAFAREAQVPKQERYLTQLRIVEDFALDHTFGPLPADHQNPEWVRGRSIAEALWSFVLGEQQRWGTSFMDSNSPSDALGGDGDFAREELAFGFMVESRYVYRIWSRAWLVRK